MECAIETIVRFDITDDHIIIKLTGQTGDAAIRQFTRADFRNCRIILKVSDPDIGPRFKDNGDCIIMWAESDIIQKIRQWASIDIPVTILGIVRKDGEYQLYLPDTQNPNFITFSCNQIGLSVFLETVPDGDDSTCKYDSSRNGCLVIYTNAEHIAIMKNGTFPERP